ncbi:MAG: ComF family protein [Lachnospiraceae bacterium]|nr:ComF family protein [Lachnospiraceae bacterium]
MILDFLFPQRCIGCDEVLEPWEKENGVCTSCIKSGAVKIAKEPLCKKCGVKLNDETMEYCERCSQHSHIFIQAKPVFLYSGEAKNGMYRFKYSNRRAYARTYAKTAVKLHSRWLKQIKPDVIIPVPMYKKKEKERGYNQAAVFGRELSKATGILFDDKMLIRVKNTTPLKTLGAEERQKNVKNAFQIADKGVKYKVVLIVDDIFTTGATADESARTLLEAGVESVYVMTVCVGEA